MSAPDLRQVATDRAGRGARRFSHCGHNCHRLPLPGPFFLIENVLSFPAGNPDTSVARDLDGTRFLSSVNSAEYCLKIGQGVSACVCAVFSRICSELFFPVTWGGWGSRA